MRWLVAWWIMSDMVAVQSTDEMVAILGNLVDDTIAELQVLGINSLKSVAPSPAEVTGARVVDAAVADRTVAVRAGEFVMTFDLQRAGRLVWLNTAQRARIGQPGLPTIRLILGSGSGLDFSEPAKTKRISVQISRA